MNTQPGVSCHTLKKYRKRKFFRYAKTALPKALWQSHLPFAGWDRHGRDIAGLVAACSKLVARFKIGHTPRKHRPLPFQTGPQPPASSHIGRSRASVILPYSCKHFNSELFLFLPVHAENFPCLFPPVLVHLHKWDLIFYHMYFLK